MHTSAMDEPPTGRGRRVVPTTLAVLVLLAVVALASQGGTPLGTGGARRPSDRLLDYVVSGFLALMVVGVVLMAFLFVAGRDALRDVAMQRKRRSPVLGVVVLALVLIAMAVVIRNLREDQRAVPRLPGIQTARVPGATGTTGTSGGGETKPYEPEFTLWPVLIVAGLATGAGVALLAAARARSRARPGGETTLAEAIGDLLDETLDDLRAERDARRAVIRAYARLERTLAAYGFPRRPAEAPHEYLERMLADLAVSSRSIARLTTLYERAKFSQHEVPAAMKEDAIDALETVRDELRAAELQAERERAAALEAARERAAL